MVFKAFEVWQITGDASITNSLSQNFVSLVVGCKSPRTIVQTPVGIIFVGVDGVYTISSFSQVIPLTNSGQGAQQDISQPFQNNVTPSRMAASFSGFVYRVTVTPAIPVGSNTVDYWFDTRTRRWSGAHTFAYDMADSYSDYFIVSSRTAGAKLFASQYLPTPSSVYNDNGSSISISMTPAFLPKQENPNIKQVIESTVELSSPTAPTTFSFNAQGELFNALGSAIITTNALQLWGSIDQGGSGLLWGSISQGGSGALWTSNQVVTGTYSIPWAVPLVFKKLSVTVSAAPTYGIKIGTMMFKYTETGYTNIQGIT
jgi:hypothetical protein